MAKSMTMLTGGKEVVVVDTYTGEEYGRFKSKRAASQFVTANDGAPRPANAPQKAKPAKAPTVDRIANEQALKAGWAGWTSGQKQFDMEAARSAYDAEMKRAAGVEGRPQERNPGRMLHNQRPMSSSEIADLQQQYGRRVVMPNGHVLHSTWYSNPTFNEPRSAQQLKDMEKTYREWHAAKEAAKAAGRPIPTLMESQQPGYLASLRQPSAPPGSPVTTPVQSVSRSQHHRYIETAKRAELAKIADHANLTFAGGRALSRASTDVLRINLLGHLGQDADPRIRARVMDGADKFSAPRVAKELRAMEQNALKTRLASGGASVNERIDAMKKPELVRLAKASLLTDPNFQFNNGRTIGNVSTTALKKTLKSFAWTSDAAQNPLGAKIHAALSGNSVAPALPAKTVSAPRGMDGLTRAERKAKAGGSARGPAAPKVTAAPVTTPSGASNAERFRATYERALTEQIKTNPSRYAYGVDRAPEIAKRMTDALAAGQGDHTSKTVRAVAKTLGIKPTVGGLKAALNDLPPPAPRPQKSPLEKAEAANVKAQAERTRAWQSLQKGHISAAEWGQASRKAGEAQKAVEALMPSRTAKLSGKLGMAVAIGSTALGLVSALRSSPATAAPAPADSGKTRTKPYTDSAGREYRNGRLIVRPST